MGWLRRVVDWVRGGQNAALMEELEAHRAFTQDELERAGLPPAQAEAESRRRMGNVTLAREDARDVWIVRWIDSLRRQLRFGMRGLRREPTFAATAILTLAFGSAAVTTVFSVADAELWRSLPYTDAEQLVVLRSEKPAPERDTDVITMAELSEWRQALSGLTTIVASGDDSTPRRAVRLTGTESMRSSEVTANYFSELGRRAIVGRVFGPNDAHGSDAIVLGARGWRRVFSADPSIVGRTVFVDNEAKVVVGIVEPDDSMGGLEGDLFLPINESRGTQRLYGGLGRLAPGSTAAQVQAQLQAILDRHAAIDTTRAGHIARVELANDFYKRSDARPLYFFLGASVFVLVLTIVNLAGLVLARSVRRAPEFALRGALGGGAKLILLQLTAEAALIAVPGCAIGFWLTRQLLGTLSTLVPSDMLWRGTAIALDYRAAAVVAIIVLVTVAGLALAPLGVAHRADASIVKAGGSRSSGLPWAGRVRERLLVGQIALTVVLLVAGGLFLQSFTALTRMPLGFDPADGWTMSVTLSGDRYKDPALIRQYTTSLIQDVRAIPGVRSAALATSSPLRSGWVVRTTRPGAETADAGVQAIYRAIGPGYFSTIGTAITRGRAIDATDVAGAPNVAVVNQEFVHRVLHDEDPIGRQIALGGIHAPVKPTVVTIVGVAASIKEVGFNEVAFADIYVAFDQYPVPGGELLVRGNGADSAMPALLRAAAAKADPFVPVSSVSPMSRRVTVALQEDKFNFVLAIGFAVIALLVASIGIYGAMAYAASARAREFGVRLALGASPRMLMQKALSGAARFGVLGAGIGIALALALSRWIGDALYLVPGKHNGLLYGVQTTDPIALAGAAGSVLLVALVAGFIPARRLARVDPVKTLRAE